jgi:ferredoxin
VSFTVTLDCVGCGACLATCPEAAFRVDTSRTPQLVILAPRCSDCAACAEVCPVEACVPQDGWSS